MEKRSTSRASTSRVGARTLATVLLSLISVTAWAQANGGADPSGQAQRPAPTAVLKDYSRGVPAFPSLLSPYKPIPIPPVQLENSAPLHDLVQDGHLRVSLSETLALAIENNLDIAVQRYIHPIAQADMLRTRSGQAARGVPGALLPSGLSAGALGVGVNQAGGTGGVGGAGGISGGGGAVSVPQVGTFDPAVSLSTSYDSTAAPLNSLVVAGVPRVSTASSATSVNYRREPRALREQ